MSVSSLFSVAGKVAIITGGTSGIGHMIASGLVAQGVKTYIVGRDPASCARVAAELAEQGDCLPLPGDIATVQGIECLVEDFFRQETRLDILINNAGSMYEAPLGEFTEAGWDEVMDLNLKSVFFLSQALLPALRSAASETDPAAIVNIGSVGGLRVGPKENYSYQAAKAGLHHLTASLAKRLAGEQITVNAVAPGFFASRMTTISDEMLPQILAAVPRNRLGQAEDMVGAVTYLASRAGSFVTGTVIPVAGGMTL